MSGAKLSKAPTGKDDKTSKEEENTETEDSK